MTVTVLDRALVAGDAGGMTGEQERPDPEVPERARRRSFTAQYKLDVVAEYDAAATGEKGAVLCCPPLKMPMKATLAMPVKGC
jgi:transposase